MEPLALALEIVELAVVARESDLGIDVDQEAKRLLLKYPSAAKSEAVVAAALRKAIAADTGAR
jgi:hypothetical protein